MAVVEGARISLPCHFLPFGHNPNFYGRATIIQHIQEALAPRDDDSRIRSIALWGTGGIGKSQIALEFASRQDTSELPIILWIPSEKETEVANAFNNAAQKLNLPGVLASNTPDRNRDLVLQYLQRTDARWLLIFDNVEDDTDLQPIWPTTGHGTIIVTSRSALRADALVDEVTQVPTFTTDEGSEFLLKYAGQRATSDADVVVAKQFSDRLGGLALALEIIGKQIKTRSMSAANFLPFYNRNRQAMSKEPKRGPKNPYYDKDLETVWEAAFDSLTEEASKFLMLLCFLAPTDVPEGIFSKGKNLPEDYSFLSDEVMLDEAKIELVNLSLITLNGESGLISMHRLTQQAYFDRMTLEDRRSAFKVPVGLLQDNFSRTAGRHLYTRWKLCSTLIQHVQAFVDRYMDLGNTEFLAPFEPLTFLIANASWYAFPQITPLMYLQETGAFMASEALIKAAFLNCEDKSSLAYAWLADAAGTIHERQGHGFLTLDFDQAALDIHIEKSPAGSVELANAYSAVGVQLTSIWRAAEGVESQMNAIANSPTDHDEKLKFNPDRYLRNRARSYFVEGKYEASKTDLKDAEYWQTLIHGKDSHYHGESAYMLGKLAAREGKLDDASNYLQRAVDLMSVGKPTHASVGAAKFQQGVVCMLKNKEDEDMNALRLFRDALLIAQINEAGKGTEADSARVKWRMSQVMERQGMTAESKAFGDAAEATKKKLLATGLYAKGAEEEQEEQDYDALVGKSGGEMAGRKPAEKEKRLRHKGMEHQVGGMDSENCDSDDFLAFYGWVVKLLEDEISP
ncbi:hypothetical protein DL98DRAFT_572409 [Cadophora sp. DSE1049]|nr:hypothetical protein DL98DRAFT_572409 [Cadophora sp. DSE1049]